MGVGGNEAGEWRGRGDRLGSEVQAEGSLQRQFYEDDHEI